jgi:NTE family protein
MIQEPRPVASDAAPPAPGGKRIALVLGSGGARGIAHIGVIAHLEALGHRIVYISGCSMGALVGGIYAAGKLHVYESWLRALERRAVIGLLDLTFGRPGLFKGERLIGVLRELIGDHEIQDLPIGYTAVATDLVEQREIWLNRGPLFDAIRASIAIPTIFTPYELHGRLLVDGGLLNPVPIAPALNQQADLIVAVNLNANLRSERESPEQVEAGGSPATVVVPGLLDVLSMTMETMQNAITRLKLAAYSPDVVVEVPRDACSFYEFYRAAELIELGRVRAEAALGAVPAQRKPLAGA